MSVKITIGDTVINFPTSGTDANWAEAVVEFAEAVQDKLLQVGLPYDLAPQVLALPEVSTITLGSFPSAEVRAITLNYATYRVASSPVTSKEEIGVVSVVFNETVGQWTLQHEFSGDKKLDGTSYLTFAMTGNSLEVTPETIGGTYDTANSTISFSAKTLAVSI
jgi:hypothetical protein